MRARLPAPIIAVSVLSLLFAFPAPQAHANHGRHLGQMKHGHRGYDQKHGDGWNRHRGYPDTFDSNYSADRPSYGDYGIPGYSSKFPPSYRPGYGYPSYRSENEDYYSRHYLPRYNPGWQYHGRQHYDDDQGDNDQGDYNQGDDDQGEDD